MKTTIIIPDFRTPSRNMTATKHWRAYQQQRDDLCGLIRAYMRGEGVIYPACVTIEAYYKGKRGVDTSNLDDKIIVDGLMHAGILENDTAIENPKVIKQVYLETGKDELVITVGQIM